ncbi:MAG TPA: FHA domain-containing protein, partial [Noviherbaspirillum sp.]
RTGGLDNLRQDLRRYTEIQNAARARNLGRLLALTAKARFSTPPFQEKFRALQSGNQLPPADVVAQYQAAMQAWRSGDTKQAYGVLQKMVAGPWAEAAARQLERKKTLEEQFAQLQKTRGADGYDDRLLAFYGSLDPDEDVYFMKAVDADIAALKDKALRRAQELLSSAQAKWSRYRDNGAIEGQQRLEGAISDKFRTQAQLLAQASEEARQGMRIYTQLKMEQPAEWRKVQDEINAEAEQQRKAMQDVRDVLTPELWKTKLTLLGGQER